MGTFWRYWATGGLAVLLAATVQFDGDGDGGDAAELRRRTSPFPVAETVERLESSARQRGLAVYAKLSGAAATGASRATLLVFGHDADETLAVQSPDGALELPLTLRVDARRDGRAEVRFADARWLDAHPDAPAELQAMVEEVGRVVDAALG